MGQCYNCGTGFAERVERSSECSQCRRDLRVCKNCFFYSPGSHYDCKEEIDDEVRDKERRNFCDYWKPSQKPGSTKTNQPDAKARFNALFKDDE